MFAYSSILGSNQHHRHPANRTESPRIAASGGGGRKHVLTSLMSGHAPPSSSGKNMAEKGNYVARPQPLQETGATQDALQVRDANHVPSPTNNSPVPPTFVPPSTAYLQLVRPVSRGGSKAPAALNNSNNRSSAPSSSRAWSGQPSPRFVFAGDTGLSSFTLVGAQRTSNAAGGGTPSSLAQPFRLVPSSYPPIPSSSTGTALAQLTTAPLPPPPSISPEMAKQPSGARCSSNNNNNDNKQEDGGTRRKHSSRRRTADVLPEGHPPPPPPPATLATAAQQHAPSTVVGSSAANNSFSHSSDVGPTAQCTTDFLLAAAAQSSGSGGVDGTGSPTAVGLLPPRPVGRQKEPLHNVDLFPPVGGVGPTSPSQSLDGVVVKEKRRKSSSTLTPSGSSGNLSLQHRIGEQQQHGCADPSQPLVGVPLQTAAGMTPCSHSNSGCSAPSSSDDDDGRVPQSPAKRLDGSGAVIDEGPRLWAVRQHHQGPHQSKRTADTRGDSASMATQSARASTNQHVSASTNPRPSRTGGIGMEEDAFPPPRGRDGANGVGGLSSARRRAPQQVASSVDEFADPFPMRKAKKKIPIIVEDEWEWDSAWAMPNAASAAAKVDVPQFGGGAPPPPQVNPGGSHHQRPTVGGVVVVAPPSRASIDRPASSSVPIVSDVAPPSRGVTASDAGSIPHAPFRRSGPLRQQQEATCATPTTTSKDAGNSNTTRRATTIDDAFDDDDVVKSPSPSAAFVPPPLHAPHSPPVLHGATQCGGSAARSEGHFQRRFTM